MKTHVPVQHQQLSCKSYETNLEAGCATKKSSESVTRDLFHFWSPKEYVSSELALKTLQKFFFSSCEDADESLITQRTQCAFCHIFQILGDSFFPVLTGSYSIPYKALNQFHKRLWQQQERMSTWVTLNLSKVGACRYFFYCEKDIKS